MKEQSTALGNVGMTIMTCDNPNCRKNLVLAWKGRSGEYCSSKCLKLVEEKQMVDNEEYEDETQEDTAAPVAKTKKAKAAKKGKPAKKVAAKKAVAKKAKGTSTRIDPEARITVLKKDHEFRGKRVKMFSLIKTGMTTKQASDAIQKFLGGARYSGFLHICKDAGLIKWAA